MASILDPGMTSSIGADAACRGPLEVRVRDNKIMIISFPFVITLSTAEHDELIVRARAARTSHRDVLRAKIILAAAEGAANAVIAVQPQLHLDTVRKWRRRIVDRRLAGLNDLPRPGRPRRFTAVQVAEVKALACELPVTSDLPLARWSCPDLAVEAAQRGICDRVSASTVRRWLAADAIKPWQHRSWIFPRDPDFAVKAGRVLDLYARCFEGRELGEHEFVLSADEKAGVLRHPAQTPHPRQLLQPAGTRSTAERVRDPLQPSRATLRLAIQPRRPRPTHRPDRRLTPDELTGATTRFIC
jgi:transposase